MNMFENSMDPSHGSATRRVYQNLRKMILTGQLKPGEKLKIEALRAIMDTGASPIREALSLLTSDNLVERIDQRGFRTAEISAENFAEILKLRCVLEDLALRESIAIHSSDWEESVVIAHHRMSQAQNAQSDEFEDFHKAFHMALLANASSPILLKFCSQLYDLNIRYRYLAGAARSYRARDVKEEHVGILNAVIKRDADEACARLLNHYRLTGDFLAGLLGEGSLG